MVQKLWEEFDLIWGEIQHRGTRCTRTSPLPLLPSGPGGVGGIASRGTRHIDSNIFQCIPFWVEENLSCRAEIKGE